jgi:hypothetical protein
MVSRIKPGLEGIKSDGQPIMHTPDTMGLDGQWTLATVFV